MRQSQLFTKTRREAPKDEVAKNAQLLIRAGFINKEMAGVYSFLPLGLLVLNNICNVIREEMGAIGASELKMSALQSRELWEKTDRWSDKSVDNWFKTELKGGGEVGLGFTHEEPLTFLMREFVHSYRDLPVLAYQIQEKFRNEIRAKSGIIRGREFLMKDLYSFSRTDEEHHMLYEQAKSAYLKIFERVELGEKTFVTFASGGVFSKYSEEFQTLSDAGEDIIYVDEAKRIAVNKEVYTDEVLKDLGLQKSDLVEKKAIESGNIFNLGTRFSDPLDLTFTDEGGTKKPVIMGSYGLGPSRLMGTLAEVLSDEKGLVWPKAVAPFTIHLVELSGGDEGVRKAADALYEKLTARQIAVLYDDRTASAGEKFADAELIGIPYRVVVSAKTIAASAVELTERKSGERRSVSEEELLAL
ncbi:prolyl-tRNA synthetase [Candidatus Kaiserbacteria bacterium RIFCSPHIGHO2_01_FULL_49_13]|uniref:Proline--tRNA ligase n=1 Tax=Candidatus Kaiserbacteria bacterium RIFCSPHIGHO2_01_FULL_49_13 TaxID=1798477 RepID=A0A1F6CCR6_9BACT|nr:MAG: prolyl-tRNA synthetase [Candidatus Kaiserbacteria bacterium RIFCSPHIGHO2_01_FULL_49_13]